MNSPTSGWTGPGEFTVTLDLPTLARARRTTLRLHTLSAMISLVAATGIGAMTVFLVVLAGPIGLVNLPVVAILAVDGGVKLRRLHRLRATWSAPTQQTAMRLTPTGLHLSIDAGPHQVFLPWPTVQGLHIHRSWGQPLLVVDLAPGVDAATPGTNGLDHPDIQRLLHPRFYGPAGLRVALRLLHQPATAIDHAAATLTAGRIRITSR